MSKSKLEMWRNTNIKGNKYGDRHCEQIVQVLEDFFLRPGFPENAIKEFLGTAWYTSGIHIILVIVRESVARRLGLKWQPVFEHYTYTKQLSQEYNVEDDSYYGTDINAEDNSLSGDSPDVLAYKHILSNLADNITLAPLPDYSTALHKNPYRFIRMCSFPELLLLVGNPFSVGLLKGLANRYLDVNINKMAITDNTSLRKEILQTSDPERLKCIVNTLKKDMANECRDRNIPKNVQLKVRPPNLKYAVGMVMNYHSSVRVRPRVCVICDWDPDRLTSDGQPIYNALLKTQLYKNISEDKLKPIANKAGELQLVEDIGRHFSHVFGSHFVPNAEKEREYPADTAVRHAYHRKMYKSKIKSYRKRRKLQ